MGFSVHFFKNKKNMKQNKKTNVKKRKNVARIKKRKHVFFTSMV